ESHGRVVDKHPMAYRISVALRETCTTSGGVGRPGVWLSRPCRGALGSRLTVGRTQPRRTRPQGAAAGRRRRIRRSIQLMSATGTRDERPVKTYRKVRNLRYLTLGWLRIAGVRNYMDSSPISIAGPLMVDELGISHTASRL